MKLLDRINRVIHTDAFERCLGDHGINLFEFQANWAGEGRFENLPRVYQEAILAGEKELGPVVVMGDRPISPDWALAALIAEPKFPRFSRIHHTATGTQYVVSMVPEACYRLEAVNEAFYAYYRADLPVAERIYWFRRQSEMEDGRFTQVTITPAQIARINADLRRVIRDSVTISVCPECGEAMDEACHVVSDTLVGKAGRFSTWDGEVCVCVVLEEGVDLPWEKDMLLVRYVKPNGAERCGHIPRSRFEPQTHD